MRFFGGIRHLGFDGQIWQISLEYSSRQFSGSDFCSFDVLDIPTQVGHYIDIILVSRGKGAGGESKNQLCANTFHTLPSGFPGVQTLFARILILQTFYNFSTPLPTPNDPSLTFLNIYEGFYGPSSLKDFPT